MKEKKPSWLINYGVGLTLLFILLASIVSPVWIYAVMAFIGAIAVVNMINMEKMKINKEPEEEVEETPPEPPKMYKKGILKKARKYLENGYTIEEIREGLSEKYTKSVVDSVINELEV